MSAPALHLVPPNDEPDSPPQSLAVYGKLFLFSVDLEDIRLLIPHGERYSERVAINCHRYLELLAKHDMRATFFTTGDVARRYPELIREVVDAGHEIGCHTSDHLPLDRHTPESFREDILRCLDDYASAGAEHCVGFRAPVGSLIKATRWVYPILQEVGFEYSSSVVPAANPLYGWPDFGTEFPTIVDDIWELPTPIAKLPGLACPFGGGVYFRVLPMPLLRYLFRQRNDTGHPILSYFHPYDIDIDQERFMHPEINDSLFYNWLLYYNRRGLVRRIEKFLASDYRIIRYDEYVEKILGPATRPELLNDGSLQRPAESTPRV